MYNVNDTKRYSVWACRPGQPDELIDSGRKLWDADMMVEVMNADDDTTDYRVAEDEPAIPAEWFE